MPEINLPNIMGVLNVTPDSFSDGGKYTSTDAALAQAKDLISQGASILDIGGESTRPGAERVTAAQELSRVLPVIEALSQLPEVRDWSVRLSIDTLNSSTAKIAIEAGVKIVNDVSGGFADQGMFEALSASFAADPNLTYVLGHWQNFHSGAQAVQQTADVVAAVADELAARVGVAEAAGIKRNQIVLDPGLGFGKSSTQNWQLLAGFQKIAQLGLPIMIGASRKRFLASAVSSDAEVASVSIDRRDGITATLSALLWSQLIETKVSGQLWALRVHNVEANIDALRVAAALRFAH